jgi:hypothetical protein
MTGELVQDKTIDTSLKDLLSVAKYLKDKGYRIGKSSVYNHKHAGKIKPDPTTGHYLIADVDKYASLHLERLDGTTKSSQKLDSFQIKKIASEARIREAQAETWEIRAKTAKQEVIPVAAVNIRDAAKATTLRSDDLNWIYSRAASIIQVVHGDPSLEPDLIEFLRTDREMIFSRYDEKTLISVDLPAMLLDGIENVEQIEGLGLSNG